MKDKVSELREILNHKKTMEARKNDTSFFDTESTESPDSNLPNESTSSAAETSTDTETSGESSPQAEAVLLQSQIEEYKNAALTQKDMFLRQAAEFENMKKRLQKEHEDFRKYAYEKVVEEFIPVLDNLEMTLGHIKNQKDPIAEGVLLTVKQFLTILEKYGVSQISGEGEAFNPNLQEAINMQPAAGVKSNTVITVHRKGYKLYDKVLRAAMVTVSS